MSYQKFKQLLTTLLLELDNLHSVNEQRRQTVELDQAKVGRLSRMDALQKLAIQYAVNEKAYL